MQILSKTCFVKRNRIKVNKKCSFPDTHEYISTLLYYQALFYLPFFTTPAALSIILAPSLVLRVISIKMKGKEEKRFFSKLVAFSVHTYTQSSRIILSNGFESSKSMCSFILLLAQQQKKPSR